MSNLKRHIKGDKVKWISTAIALLLISVALVGVCLQMFGKDKQKPSEWFERNDSEQSETKDNTPYDLIVAPQTSTNSRMRLSVNSATRDYSYGDSWGEMGYLEGALCFFGSVCDISRVITAEVYPFDATDKSLSWSIAWRDSSITSDVADYVAITCNESDTSKCFLHCTKVFDNQIIVTATLDSAPEITATCTLDFMKRYSAWRVTMTGYDVLSKQSKEVSFYAGSNGKSISTFLLPWDLDFIPQSYRVQPEHMSVSGGTVYDDDYTCTLDWRYSDAWLAVNRQERLANRQCFVSATENSAVSSGQWIPVGVQELKSDSEWVMSTYPIQLGRYMGVYDSTLINNSLEFDAYSYTASLLRSGSAGAPDIRGTLKAHCRNIEYPIEFRITAKSQYVYFEGIVAFGIDPDTMKVDATNVDLDSSSVIF